MKDLSLSACPVIAIFRKYTLIPRRIMVGEEETRSTSFDARKNFVEQFQTPSSTPGQRALQYFMRI